MTSLISGNTPRRLPDPIIIEQNDRTVLVNGRPSTPDEVARLTQGRVNVTTAGFRTGDGFQITSSNVSALTQFGGQLPLPSVRGPMLDNVSLGNRMSYLNEVSDGALMWMTLSTLARTQMRDMSDSKELKNALESQKIHAKQMQIKATEKQIAAERKAALESLAWGIAAAAASFAAGYLTAGVGATSSAAAKGVAAAAQSLGQLVNATGAAVSKNIGAGREVDEKRLQVKHWERQEAMLDQGIESAKSNYEEAKELFKQALKIITEHVERNSQVIQKLTT